MRSTTARWAGLVVACVLCLAACGGGSSSDGATDTTPTTTAVTTTVTTGATSPTTSPATVKVSANDATRAELQAAFTAAGISSPAQWAREVEEYRPYPVDDPTFAKLRRELAKYNPGPGVVDQIVATLVL